MNTYFDLKKGRNPWERRFDSREKAMAKLAEWKADAQALALSVHEVQNTEVTRKTSKGRIITETVRGSLESVPRIVSVSKVYATYVVVQGRVEPSDLCRGYHRHFASRAEAEEERTNMMLEAERLAALTEADIKEVQVPTLADILERDGDKIEALEDEVREGAAKLENLKKQAEVSIAEKLADLKNQIAAVEQKAAQEFGLREAEEKLKAAVNAHHAAIHFDELEEEALGNMQNDHSSDCWPNSDCRVAGECTYANDIGTDDVEEYLLEHAEDFEVESESEVQNKSAETGAAAA